MRRLGLALAAFATLLLATNAAEAASGSRPRIAVWEVKVVPGTPGISVGTAEVLTDVVATDLAQTGAVQVIARQDVLAVLGFEKHKAQMGCVEQGCLAEIGGALGADYVVSGQIGKLGDQFRVSLIAVDAKSALAVARAAEFCPLDEGALAAASRVALKQLFEQLSGTFPKASVAKPASHGAAEAKRLAADAKRHGSEGKYREAALAWDEALNRDPGSADRCGRLAQAGSAWEQAGDKAEAATRLRAVGTEPACASQNASAAAKALDKAATLFDTIGRKDDALAAWKVLAGMKVSDPQAQARVLQARMRLGLSSEGK